MTIPALAFYLFAGITIASAVMVISARNPVHSVLFLILAFFNSAALLVLLGAEFIAFILIVVYVGAVAVLFLFVVMMLDINFGELRRGFLQYLPVGGLVALILLVELGLVIGGWVIAPGAIVSAQAPAPPPEQVTNTEALGRLIYTEYLYLFQASGLVLLIAMIGAIVLTLRTRPAVRKQDPGAQASRRREDVIAVTRVNIGDGA